VKRLSSIEANEPVEESTPRGDGGPPSIRPAPVRDHTDAELVLLESLVGRVPPFHGDEGAGRY